jgi:hypothetical protein
MIWLKHTPLSQNKSRPESVTVRRTQFSSDTYFRTEGVFLYRVAFCYKQSLEVDLIVNRFITQATVLRVAGSRSVVTFHWYSNCCSFFWSLSYFLYEFSSVGPDGLSEGDWTCPKCDNINFSFRTTCNMKKCGAPRPTTPVSSLVNTLPHSYLFSCDTV